MDKVYRKLEVCANIAIIVVAVLLAVILIRPLITTPTTSNTENSFKEISAGEKVPLEGIDWGANDRTMLVVISQGCHYCSESAPFYKRIAETTTHNNVKLIAILPQSVSDAEKYLGDLGLQVNETRQASLGSIRVKGTPTLLLVDKSGTVVNKWLGKLPPEVELEVLKEVQCESCGS